MKNFLQFSQDYLRPSNGNSTDRSMSFFWYKQCGIISKFEQYVNYGQSFRSKVPLYRQGRSKDGVGCSLRNGSIKKCSRCIETLLCLVLSQTWFCPALPADGDFDLEGVMTGRILVLHSYCLLAASTSLYIYLEFYIQNYFTLKAIRRLCRAVVLKMRLVMFICV